MRPFNRFRAWLNALPFTDPVKQRVAPVLQLFFISLIVILLVAIGLAFILIGPSWLTPAAFVSTSLFGLALVIGLWLLRRGYFNVALAIIILALIVNQARGFLASGFLGNQQNLFSSIWPLALAAFLLGRRWLVITAVANVALIAAIAFREQAVLLAADTSAHPQTVERLTGFVLVIILTAILFDLFANAFRQVLDASLQRARDLEAEISARKKIEQSLANQREQYRVTLASIGDAVIATDTAGDVMFMNEVAADLTGWPPHEALGKPLHEVFPIINEDTLAPVENPLIKVLADGVVIGLANHTALIRRDGDTLPIADSGAPIRDADGGVIGAVLVFRDVTEERRGEAELKESEERFRMMADSAPVLIWMGGVDGSRHYFNQQWLLFTGRTLEQDHGEGWTQIVYADDYERYMDVYTDAVGKREPFSLEYRLRRADGQYRWLLVHGEPRFASDGEFLGYIGTCVDIHERIEAEARTQLLQTLTAALSSAVTIDDVAQVIVEQAFDLLGAELGAIGLLEEKDQTLKIIAQHNIPAQLLAAYQPNPISQSTPLNDAVRTNQPVWIETFEQFEARYPLPASRTQAAGAQIQALASLPLVVNKRVIGGLNMSFRQPQVWDDKRRAFLIALAHQCAQAMERAILYAQAQFTAALEERQRLARDLHDAVSQTLFSASIIAESLPNLWERNPARGAEQMEQLVTLNRAALSEMRTLLLELRPEAISNTNLSALLQQLVDAARGRKSIQARLDYQGKDDHLPPNVHVAFYRIAQESINNILKHSGATEFTVRLNAQPERLELHIHDNGRGFDLHAVSTGMGLNNIRERAAAIKAAFDLDSAPDQGTRVAVRWGDA